MQSIAVRHGRSGLKRYLVDLICTDALQVRAWPAKPPPPDLHQPLDCDCTVICCQAVCLASKHSHPNRSTATLFAGCSFMGAFKHIVRLPIEE